jgi:uncharacterized protein (TIGR00730 family)
MASPTRPRPLVSVFGSSRPEDGSPEYAVARELGRQLAGGGYGVCNGGYGGTMEASARGAKEGGGATVGVVTSFFSTEANRYIDEKIIEPTLVARLLKLIELGDAYVVLPGSTGTLLELSAVWEFMNKRIMPPKPLVAVGEFWNPVVATLRQGLAFDGRGDASRLVTTVATSADCIAKIKQLLPR